MSSWAGDLHAGKRRESAADDAMRLAETLSPLVLQNYGLKIEHGHRN